MSANVAALGMALTKPPVTIPEVQGTTSKLFQTLDIFVKHALRSPSSFGAILHRSLTKSVAHVLHAVKRLAEIAASEPADALVPAGVVFDMLKAIEGDPQSNETAIHDLVAQSAAYVSDALQDVSEGDSDSCNCQTHIRCY